MKSIPISFFCASRMNEFVEEISKSNLIQSLEVELHLMDISHYAKLLEDTFKEIGVSSGVLKYENCSSRSATKSPRPTNCWFDNSCKNQKRKVNNALKQWKKDLTNSILK